jgi:hypothetical protein
MNKIGLFTIFLTTLHACDEISPEFHLRDDGLFLTDETLSPLHLKLLKNNGINFDDFTSRNKKRNKLIFLKYNSLSNSSKKRYLESLKGLSLRGDRNSQEKLGVIHQKTFNFKNSYLYYYLYYFQHVEFRPVEEKSILVKLISERFEVVEKQIGLNLSVIVQVVGREVLQAVR